MSIFDLFCADIESLINGINQEVDLCKLSNDNNEKNQRLNKINQNDAELSDLLKQTELEARSNDDSTIRRNMNEKIKAYKNQLSSIRSEVEALKFHSQKSSLTGRSKEDAKNKVANQQ